jgi:hypothetical protein
VRSPNHNEHTTDRTAAPLYCGTSTSLPRAIRSDFQTTTLSLDELNAHGGEYDFVADVALVVRARLITPHHGIRCRTLHPQSTTHLDTKSHPLGLYPRRGH